MADDVSDAIARVLRALGIGGPEPPKPPAITTPAINDAFWYEQSKLLVQGAVAKRDAAAEKLQDAIKWVWTAYTAAAIVGSAAIGKDYSTGALLAMGLPVVVLPVAFLLAGWIVVPGKYRFYAENPASIESAYYAVAKTKDSRMQLAIAATGIGTLAVVVAILVAALAAPDSEATTFDVALANKGKADSVARNVLVSGEWEAGTLVDFVVTTTDASKRYVQRSSRLVPPGGELHTQFRVGKAVSYSVKGTWDEEKVGRRSLTIEVAGEKKKPS